MHKIAKWVGLPTLAIVFGLSLPQVSFASISSSSLVQLVGTNANDKFGRSVATGDINGDGYQDLITGAPNNTTTYVTLTYGSSAQLSSQTVSSTNTVVLTSGSSSDSFGAHISTGDLNGDGYDDIVVGAAADSAGGGTNYGAIYIIYGKVTQYTSETISSDSSIPKLTGTNSGQSGAALAIGNLNGDAYADLAIGAPSEVTSTGAVYLIYGSSTAYTGTTTSISTAAAAKYRGEATQNNLGNELDIGDLNGDGYEDLAMSAMRNGDGGVNAGAVYIAYGSSTNLSATTSVSALAEFTGEAAVDNAGNTIDISSGSINGDAYNDLLVSSPNNGDAFATAGAVYLVPGSATQYSSTTSLGAATILEFTGAAASDSLGTALATGDVNADGYTDMFMSSVTATSTDGLAYLYLGSASLTSGSVSSGASQTFIGTASSAESFGRSIAVDDLNGDNRLELIVGAHGYSSSAGAVYVGYLSIDADEDGVLSSTGLVYTGTDCNDSDATVSASQTYYADTDADTLGDPLVTTSLCSSTAPAGYVANANDTDDLIPNNGVEISGDAIDNDGDGEIDEHNTLEENGAHPYYSTLDPADSAESTLLTVTGMTMGRVKVKYADNSIYDYPVFDSASTKKTKVEQFKQSGYGVVLHKKGTKTFLLNLLSGEKADTLVLSSKASDSKDLLLGDLRKDGSTEAIVTTKTGSTVKVYVIHVKKKSGSLALYDKTGVASKKVNVNKTKIKKNTILLRSKTLQVIEALQVNKTYQFVEA